MFEDGPSAAFHPGAPAAEDLPHFENFTLEDFVNPSEHGLHARVKPCSDCYRQLTAAGRLQYCREIVGPMSSRVQVRDHASGIVRPMLMLGSNNYLGLTTHPHVVGAVQEAIAAHGIGVGGPPILNGMSSLHRRLEQRLAAFKQSEDAMLFASGYQANLGIVDGLLRAGDLLLCDEQCHASLFDGIRMAKPLRRFKTRKFRHNDVKHLIELLREAYRGPGTPPRQVFVAVEGVYSMDGDVAPLAQLVAACEEHGALVILDDAHGTGVMGECGRGTAAACGVSGRIAITMGTFSKAFGVTGAFVTGSTEIIDYLRLYARPYMFSAHLPTMTVASVLAGLDVMEAEPDLLTRLHDNARRLCSELHQLGFDCRTDSAIIAVRIRAGIDMRELCRRLDQEGLFINAIEYPAVKPDEQRLRISVMATHTEADLDEAIRVLTEVGRTFRLIPEEAS